LAATASGDPPEALTYQTHMPFLSSAFAPAWEDVRMRAASEAVRAAASSVRRRRTAGTGVSSTAGRPGSSGSLAAMEPGESLPELRVTPDKYLPHRYAGASGDFNPIHIDPEFAKAVGLPQNILHGLYSMAQVARAHTEAAGGDPRALRRLKVQFRGMGVPEQEIVVQASVSEAENGRVVTKAGAAQGDNRIIRNAEGELALG